MVEIAPRIVVDPAVRFGKPTIRGTRVPVALVLAKLAGGMTAATLQDEYDLQPEDIQAALHYAAQLVADEELIAEGDPAALLVLMDHMSREASQNGLTPEILDSILSDE